MEPSLGAANDSLCSEQIACVERENLTHPICQSIFDGPSLPAIFMAVVQMFYALVLILSLCSAFMCSQ